MKTSIKTVINPGFNEILGTDSSKDSDMSLGGEYYEYRKKWEEYPQKGILSDFPLHVDLETTNACNLKCTMCMRNYMTGKVGYMDWGLFKKVIDEGAEFGLSSVKFHNRGEPLLHPKIIDMVRYAKDKGILSVEFNTNGMLLTEQTARCLIEAGLDRIILSLDGATKETYEKIRIGAVYETVVENIKRFVRMRNTMGQEKPSVRIQMVEMNENAAEVGKFVDMWKPIANSIAVNKVKYLAGTQPKQRITEAFACPQLWQRLNVCWDGEVRMCCGDWQGKFVLGNAKETSIRELWHGVKHNAVRSAHENGEYDKFAVCAGCEVNKR